MCGSANFSNLYQDFINSTLSGLTLYIGGAGHCLRSGMERLLAFVTPAHAHIQLSPILKFLPLELLLSLLSQCFKKISTKAPGHCTAASSSSAPSCIRFLYFSIENFKGLGRLIKTRKWKGKNSPLPWGNWADIP